MKLLQTEITPLTNDLIHVDFRSQQFLSSPFHMQPTFHAHPELELVFIIEGFGKRIIGNKIEPFESGDLVFIGSNVSHLWLSDPIFYEKSSHLKSKAIVVYFNPQVFSQIFASLKEFRAIQEMIHQSSKGIRIFGETRKIIANKLLEVSLMDGFEKVEGLLRILNLISTSDEKSFIIDNESDCQDYLYKDKLIEVVNYIKDNLHTQITLTHISAVACMTEQSFCRFFKKRTGRSFSQFINDLRISKAQDLLIQTDKSIGEIAILCGYNSDSHFCKIFKDHLGHSPYKYKLGLF